MRYIRTKNGIYDLYKSIWREFTGRKIKTPYCEEYEKQPKLCKSADTIKELCDRFVVIYENEEPVPYKNYLDALATQKEVYGAIWTDKGLIYVAKMNEKGGLEWL